jgi:hypothetical protein
MKNKINIYIKTLAVLIGFISISSCVHDDNWDKPETNCEAQNITVNKTISDVLALSPSGDLTEITEETTFEAYVVSSDEHGNFYTTIILQDAPANPTAGISVSLDKRDAYTDLPVGQKVIVKAKGLFVAKVKGVYKLGATYNSTYGGVGIGRINGTEANKRIIATCDAPVEIIPTVVDLGSISDANINTLVKIEQVQFKKADLCSTYAYVGESGVNKYIEDVNGRDMILRNSGYADFATQRVPAGMGDIVAVLGKYRSDFQLYIRDTDDVQFTNNRFDGTMPTCEAPASANATIADLKAVSVGGAVTEITSDLVVDVVVTADDEFGNFYKKIFVQDATGSLQLSFQMRDLFQRGYKVGNKIRIKAQGMYIGTKNDEYILGGSLYNGSVGYIKDDIDQDHLFVLPETATPVAEVKNITDLTNDDLGKLVQFNDVQFSAFDVNEQLAYDDADNYPAHPKSANRTFLNCNGDEMIMRTSGYSLFTNAHTPVNKGSITGILGAYHGVFQVYIRNIQDLNMTQERCNPELLDETFGRGVPSVDLDITGWTNYNQTGTRKWFANAYYRGAVNVYAEMNAYQSNETVNIAWLVSPGVQVAANSVLNFQTAKAYWKHDALSVLISTDFNGVDVTGATWTPLTARLATNTDANHAWIDSGDVDLSAYAGQTVYIAFRYVGGDTPTATTTYRIDNVVIK